MTPDQLRCGLNIFGPEVARRIVPPQFETPLLLVFEQMAATNARFDDGTFTAADVEAGEKLAEQLRDLLARARAAMAPSNLNKGTDHG